MIFQEPMSSLNPCFTVGFQIGETLKTHLDLERGRARQAHRRASGRGRHSRSRAPRSRLSPSALGRHEPARDDRDGARLPAQTPDRRRADDGARRHHPGANPRSSDAAAPRQRHGAGAHHPRHGRRRRDRRPGHCPICRAAGGDERARASCSPIRIIPIPRRCWRRCRSGRTGGGLPAIPGVVPGQFDRPRGCLFSPRCAFVFDACHDARAAAGGARARPRALSDAACSPGFRARSSCKARA